jgi:hypothetical protein
LSSRGGERLLSLLLSLLSLLSPPPLLRSLSRSSLLSLSSRRRGGERERERGLSQRESRGGGERRDWLWCGGGERSRVPDPPGAGERDLRALLLLSRGLELIRAVKAW